MHDNYVMHGKVTAKGSCNVARKQQHGSFIKDFREKSRTYKLYSNGPDI